MRKGLLSLFLLLHPLSENPLSRKALFDPVLMPALLSAARDAGALIMRHYRANLTVDSKEDASPVTQADRDADRLIVEALKQLAPSFPVVSEEGEKPDVAETEYFWLVDPLDGTKSFVRGSGYFTVNIGLIHQRAPVAGVIYDPVADHMYWGSRAGAFMRKKDKEAIPIRMRIPESGRQVAYISHRNINHATQAYLNARGISERIPCASSIKFCFLAEGKADIYPRFGPTMEWDTAAGHAILAAAGGNVTTPEGTPFLYGKTGFLNGDFVASSR